MEEAVDTIPSILNKCLFVSPDGRTHGRTDARSSPMLYAHLVSLRLRLVNNAAFIIVAIDRKQNPLFPNCDTLSA